MGLCYPTYKRKAFLILASNILIGITLCLSILPPLVQKSVKGKGLLKG